MADEAFVSSATVGREVVSALGFALGCAGSDSPPVHHFHIIYDGVRQSQRAGDAGLCERYPSVFQGVLYGAEIVSNRDAPSLLIVPYGGQ